MEIGITLASALLIISPPCPRVAEVALEPPERADRLDQRRRVAARAAQRRLVTVRVPYPMGFFTKNAR
jgi:hypothetical protein